MKSVSFQARLFRSIVCVIGSAKLAVIELLELILLCAIASFREGGVGILASHSIFLTTLVSLLATTLMCATLARWPWRFLDIAFVGIHYGLILILIGSMIQWRYGFETQLKMHAGKTIHETQMVFAKYAPVVVQREKSVPSGVKIALRMVQDEPLITLEGEGGSHANIAVTQALEKTFQWPEEAPLKFRIRGYWPDFSMSPVGPSSRSSLPNNPAVLVELLSDTTASIQIVPETKTNVKLLQFEMMRDSREIPVDFRSVLRFTDMDGNTLLETTASMNHPGSYPPGFWRTALGLNTRFLQMGWNPSELMESTLQVRRDPGWPLQWMGAILFCCGLVGRCFFRNRHEPR